jgi:hypothetical protein
MSSRFTPRDAKIPAQRPHDETQTLSAGEIVVYEGRHRRFALRGARLAAWEVMDTRHGSALILAEGRFVLGGLDGLDHPPRGGRVAETVTRVDAWVPAGDFEAIVSEVLAG